MTGKVGIIAWHEYSNTVRRKEFILMTLGLPFFMLLVAGIGAVGSLSAINQIMKGGVQHVGVVDRSGELTIPAGIATRATLQVDPYKDIDSGQAALRAGRIAALIVTEKDYLESGSVEVYRKGGGLLNKADTIPVGTILARSLLARSGADPRIARRIVDPTGGDTKSYVLDKSGRFVPRTGAREAAKFIVPYVVSILLVTSIFISASYLLRGIADEKENRVIEVILSSVTAEELLRGKLIGLACVGLTQVGVWASIAAVPAL